MAPTGREALCAATSNKSHTPTGPSLRPPLTASSSPSANTRNTADTFLQQAQSALDSLMDTYKAQRSADKTYLAAFGLEDDPQPETII